jgi:hypothetical protein
MFRIHFFLLFSECAALLAAAGPHTTLMTPDARITGAAFQKWGAQNR